MYRASSTLIDLLFDKVLYPRKQQQNAIGMAINSAMEFKFSFNDAYVANVIQIYVITSPILVFWFNSDVIVSIYFVKISKEDCRYFLLLFVQDCLPRYSF